MGESDVHAIRQRRTLSARMCIIRSFSSGPFCMFRFLCLPAAGHPFLLQTAVRFLLPMDDVAHALKGHPGLAHIGQDPSQTANRPDQYRVVGGKRNKIPHGQIAVNGFHGSQHDNRHHLQTRDQIPHAPVEAGQGPQADPQAGERFVLLPKAVHLELFPSKSAHHPHARGVLLHHRGQLSLRLIRIRKPPGNQPIEHR